MGEKLYYDNFDFQCALFSKNTYVQILPFNIKSNQIPRSICIAIFIDFWSAKLSCSSEGTLSITRKDSFKTKQYILD